MRLTAIHGIEPDVLRDAVAALLEAQGLNGRVVLEHRAIVLRDVRLRESVYNYLSYHNDRSGHWHAVISEKTGRPVCQNTWVPGLERTPKRAKYLQWRHWARLDNEVNELLDELGVSCTFRSSYGVLRSGTNWSSICPDAYTLFDAEGNAV